MHLQPAYLSSLFVLQLFPPYQFPHFNNAYCPISLPVFVNWSKSLDNSDQVKWPQPGSHCISANLLFITRWLPIAFLAAAVPNVSTALKSIIPVLLPPLLAHNLTSYWENWNHPKLSLPSCLPSTQKICASLPLCFCVVLRKSFPLQGNSIVLWWSGLGLESDKVKYSLLTWRDPDKFSSFTASMSSFPKWMCSFLPYRVITGN